jgi:nicotinate phosphoribosyltransferase
MQRHSGLLVDLYELTMAAGYIETRFEARATFELFVRNLPPRRSYLVAAGLEQALDFLENVRFFDDEISYLRQHPAFRHIGNKFFDYLAQFHFTGEVWAMPEGTLFFPGEPMLRVTGPIAEAQIVETYLLATLNFQTLVASKAARVVTAARGRGVIEFGTRRAHGIESGVLAARAAFIGGCQGTSNVQAGQRFGIATYGTQAHSWIMAHEDEEEAFRLFLDVFPEHAVLLVDTYDVRAAVEKIIAMGRKPRGVRLDSGDLAADSAWVRERLNAAGWTDVEVFASGDLDEDKIAALLEGGARIDAFGVGTALATSADAPTLGVIYKLVEVERGGAVHNAAKFSEAKVTYPGRKQVFRFGDAGGKYAEDVIALEEEHFPSGEPLLVQVMLDGKRIQPATGLDEAQRRCLESLKRVPEGILYAHMPRPSGAGQPPAGRGGAANRYPVRHSEQLEELFERVRQRVERAARI